MTNKVETRSLKEAILNSTLTEDLKSLILTTEDNLQEDLFIAKFLEWRKVARMKDGDHK